MNQERNADEMSEHKQYLESHVQPIIKPLMLDLLKIKPTSVVAYINDWCKTKGSKIEKEIKGREGIWSANQLQSDDDDNDIMEDEESVANMGQDPKRKSSRKKMAISAEVDNTMDLTNFTAPVIPKTEDQVKQINETLKINFMFSSLEEKDRNVVVSAMAIKSYKVGDTVIKQGDDGAELFVVFSGTLKCSKALEDGKEIFLKQYQKGEVFGELSLMYNAPRSATIVAETESVLLSLDRDTFNFIVKGSSMKRRNMFEDFLSRIEILNDLDPNEIAKLCDCLQTESFHKGEEVLKQGDAGNKFYLIMEGSAEAVQTDEKGMQSVVFNFKDHDYFGELALLSGDVRKATVRATSDQLVLASLDSASFKRLFGPIEAILKRNSSKYQKYVGMNQH